MVASKKNTYIQTVLFIISWVEYTSECASSHNKRSQKSRRHRGQVLLVWIYGHRDSDNKSTLTFVTSSLTLRLRLFIINHTPTFHTSSRQDLHLFLSYRTDSTDSRTI